MRRYNAFKDTRSFVQHTFEHAKGAVLDLGAGRSKYQGLIREHCDSYTTLDVVSNPGIDVVSSIENTPFQDARFDTIYCTQVFEHIPKPWLAVKEIIRILKPGGTAIITAPFLQAYHADPDDYYRYTVQGLESMFDEPELELLESGAWGGAGSVLVDMIRKKNFSEYKPARRGTWRFVRFLIKLGDWLDVKKPQEMILYLNTYVIVKRNSIT